MARIAVLGADGFIGRHLVAANPGATHIGRTELDWSDGKPDIRPWSLGETGHTHAVLAAGVTKVATCERDPQGSEQTNVTAPIFIAQRLLDDGITPVAFSSDYVFDGKHAPYGDEACHRPLQVYGCQKSMLEEQFKRLGDTLVVRLAKVYGSPSEGGLLGEMSKRLTERRVVYAARDQCFNPIWVHDAVAAVVGLCDAGATGVVNLCGPEAWSRFELAQAVASAVRADAALVREISLDDLDEPFERPKDTRMMSYRLNRLTDVRPRGPADAIHSLGRR